MAYPTTASGWITYVKDYLDVDDYTDTQIMSFIDEANMMLNRDLESQYMEAMVPYTILLANVGEPINVLSIASDFNKIRLVNMTGKKALDTVAINELINKIAEIEEGELSGTLPDCFCIDSQLLYLVPFPAEDDELQFWYYRKVPFLSAVATVVNSNIFTVNHPDLFLIAACVAASPYMSEDERIEIWKSQYADKKDAINLTAKRSKMGSTPLRRVVKTMNM